MKIVVIGGTGLIGSRAVAILRQRGHEVVAASPKSGINTITCEGLKAAVTGAQVVIDDPHWGGYLANLPPSEYEEKFAAHMPETLLGEELPVAQPPSMRSTSASAYIVAMTGRITLHPRPRPSSEVDASSGRSAGLSAHQPYAGRSQPHEPGCQAGQRHEQERRAVRDREVGRAGGEQQASPGHAEQTLPRGRQPARMRRQRSADERGAERRHRPRERCRSDAGPESLGRAYRLLRRACSRGSSPPGRDHLSR